MEINLKLEVPQFFRDVSDTVQKDFAEVVKFAHNPSFDDGDTHSKMKMSLIAARTLAVGTLACAACVGISALGFVATAPGTALLGLACAVSLYVLGHDLFVMAKNITALFDCKTIKGLTLGTAMRMQSCLKDILSQEGEAASQPFTHGTILESTWNELLLRINDPLLGAENSSL